MRFIIVNTSSTYARVIRYAGGSHVSRCMAECLAVAGQDVHLVSISDKSQVHSTLIKRYTGK